MEFNELKSHRGNQYNKKENYINNNLFINLDINISESDISLNLNKYKTIKNKNIFNSNIPTRPISLQSSPMKLKSKYNKNNIYKLSNETNSTTTNYSDLNLNGIKKVTFSTVEIIRIKKYKKL